MTLEEKTRMYWWISQARHSVGNSKMTVHQALTELRDIAESISPDRPLADLVVALRADLVGGKRAKAV